MTEDLQHRDDRKSAALAELHGQTPPGSRRIDSFEQAREILRVGDVRQGGVGAEDRIGGDPKFLPVFFLDGEEHKRKRQAIARYLTPKAMSTTYKQVMEETSEQLVSRVRKDGRAILDQIAFELTVRVAGEIVGLTESDNAQMAKRIQATLISTRTPHMHPALQPLGRALEAAYAIRFFVRDVRPAIKVRKQERRVDVISHLIDEGYPDKSILVECMTYALAGMVTTREFIVMASWHLLENDALRQRYLDSTPAGQTAILEELLRLEPVAALIERTVNADCELDSGALKEGEQLALNIRMANVDEAAVGACPHSLDPDRASGPTGSFLSFGEGSHRCPGAQVAMAESRVFIDALMRVPGLRLEREPKMTWNKGIQGYELRGAVITCPRS